MRDPKLVPKGLGADFEFGNSWSGAGRLSNREVTWLVLREARRTPALQPVVFDNSYFAQECDRHWLPNGSCVYEDMSHPEAATAETAGCRDHAAVVHAMIRIVRSLRRRALAGLPQPGDLFVNIHNSDGTPGNSYGNHLNVLIARQLWEDIMGRKPHVQGLWASFLAAAAPIFGQGLVLPGSNGFIYQISARAHHTGQMAALTTTEAFRRPLINTRDEPHAGDGLARLHIIPFDSNLNPATIMMRSGLVQLTAAALELGWFDPGLLLDDPLAANLCWSRSFDVRRGALRPLRLRLAQGGKITIVDWHRRLYECLAPLVERGRIPEAIVPEGAAVLQLWGRVLDDLRTGAADAVASRLDWALKFQMLATLPGFSPTLEDPSLRLADQLFGHIDDQIGIYWRCERAGMTERVIDDRRIRRFMFHGDPKTRSSLRGELVRRLAGSIRRMDWDHIELRPAHWSARGRRIMLPDPGVPGGEQIAWLCRQTSNDAELLDLLTSNDLSVPSTFLEVSS